MYGQRALTRNGSGMHDVKIIPLGPEAMHLSDAGGAQTPSRAEIVK
jgi:hypothetical protein